MLRRPFNIAMRKVFFCLAALALLFAVDPAHAQSRKAKGKTSRSAGAHKTKAGKKKGKASSKKTAAQARTYEPPATGVGAFDKVNLLHGDRSAVSALVKNPQALVNLDNFIRSCISQGAFPGCQVFAAKDGEIIYQKNFGYFSYDRMQPVTDSSLFDIASVTKVAATTLAIMKLYEEGKINIDAYLRNYLPFVKGTSKEYITIKDLLLHQAGLKAFIPFYKKTIDPLTGSPRTDLFHTYPDKTFSVPVAANFYMRNDYEDSIWEDILSSPMDRGRYVYSDLDFYFLQKVAEAVSGTALEPYVNTNFYKPLNLKYTMYNPWKRNLVRQCVPTENDKYFRFQHIQGYVHDPGTSMLGGVAGHAGIFSNVRDLSVIMQMLLNGGVYKGQRYLQKETVQLFTGYRSTISRRAYGFDKPEKARGDGGPAANDCSKTTFGHQGFTGTCAWADPETGIIFIFLSNRINPSADNQLINSLKVRVKAQSYIYEALGYE